MNIVLIIHHTRDLIRMQFAHSVIVQWLILKGSVADPVRDIVNRWKVPQHDLVDPGAIEELNAVERSLDQVFVTAIRAQEQFDGATYTFFDSVNGVVKDL